MKCTMGPLARHALFAVTLSLSAVVVGCAAAPTPDAEAPAVDRSLGRVDAIAVARQDAVASYGDGWIAGTSAQYQGGFWMVELKAAGGAGLRYAISSRDGSIRQRSVIQ
jgi:hypothetical protein